LAGAVLGKTTPLQMLLVVFFELIFYALNEAIGAGLLSAGKMIYIYRPSINKQSTKHL